MLVGKDDGALVGKDDGAFVGKDDDTLVGSLVVGSDCEHGIHSITNTWPEFGPFSSVKNGSETAIGFHQTKYLLTSLIYPQRLHLKYHHRVESKSHH